MSQLAVPAPTRPASASNRAAITWGIAVGAMQAATPLAFWWLDSATVYALGLALIAAIYVGFAVADGRVKVLAVETSVAFTFVILAAAAITARASGVPAAVDVEQRWARPGCWSPATSATVSRTSGSTAPTL